MWYEIPLTTVLLNTTTKMAVPELHCLGTGNIAVEIGTVQIVASKNMCLGKAYSIIDYY
jgi:hypothetical protein